jgi:hypothetical protein
MKGEVMIYIEQLKPFHVGQWVEYRGTEVGRIKSWMKTGHIFVVFHCDGNWHRYNDYTAAAVNPNDLNFIHRPKGIACLPSYAESSPA